MDLDTVLADIGEFGTYQQILLWFVLLPGVLPCGFHAYNQLFMAGKPEHWCHVPELQNVSTALAKNLSIPYVVKNGMFQYSQCHMFSRNYTNTLESLDYVESEGDFSVNTTTCQFGWNFDYSEYATTVITDWELVCEKDFYPTLALVLFNVSGLIGNYIFGFLQDSIGRRPSFFIYLFIECFFGVATAFAQDFVTWTVLRIGVGFTVPAILGTPYVLAIEVVGPEHRTTCTVLTNIAYSIGLVVLAGVVYFVRDWRQLALATSVPFLSFFLYWWVLPESPRWLLARGRFDEAEKILEKMAKVNGRPLSANYILRFRRKCRVGKYLTDKECKKNKHINYGLLDLFRTPNLRKKTLIITFIWFTNTSVYVGLSYYAPVLGGDEFLNFFLAGAVELPTYIVLWPAMEYWGRRWILCFSMVIGGTACLATVLVQNDQIVTLVLYCIGKMGISSSFVVLPLLASELYPTVVRGLGMSTSSVVGMLGPIFIPLINYLGEEMLVLPLIVMGTLLTAGGVCSLLLPETLNKELPQTLQDGEDFGKTWTWKDCLTCCPARISDSNLEDKKVEADSPIKSLVIYRAKEKLSSTPCTPDHGSTAEASTSSFDPRFEGSDISIIEEAMKITVV